MPAIESKHEASPVVVIAGPTASGKSAAALALAEGFSGTVINADSMQVYRDLSVLTARPTPEETRRVPHRLYGVMSAREICGAARWRTMALAAIAASRRGGRLPIVVGGTGLYLRALMQGLAPVPSIPADVRAAARARHAALGGEAFRAELIARDPTMTKLAAGDATRLVRAYEVIEATGRSLSLFQRVKPARARLRFTTILFAPERASLTAAIDARCARMLDAGALAELRRLLALNLDPALPAMKALGVRELATLLDRDGDREVALERFRRATRQYAKRQTTWFRHQLTADLTLGAQFSESLKDDLFHFVRKTIDLGPRRQ